MKKIFRAISVVVALALFGYLLCLDYPGFRDSLKPAGISTAEETPPEEQAEELPDAAPSEDVAETEENEVDPEAALETLHQAYPPAQTALCFCHIDESAYEELYPLLTSYNLTATLLLRNGQLPGDNEKITTAACEELVDAGWDFAVGMSEDIDLTGDPEDAAEQLDSYLEDYLERIRVRVAVRPATFFCHQGEYLEAFDEVLLDHGFTTLLYEPDGALLEQEGELKKIPVVPVSQETVISEAVETVKTFPSCVLSTRLVSEEIEDTSIDYTTTGLDLLVQMLSGDNGVSLTTVGALEPGTEAQRQERIAWLDEIAELE